MGKEVLCASVEQLREQFLTLDWTYHDVPVGRQSEKMFRWPGPPDEEILICVHKSGGRQELFHWHDTRGNTIPSVINMTTVLPSGRGNSMPGSLLRDMRSASMMTKKRQLSVF